MQAAIIVAGGSGTRAKTKVPKQFVELTGKPLLLHTLEQFVRYNPQLHLLLVLARSEWPRWQELAEKHQFAQTVTLVPGGKERFYSVQAGVEALPDETDIVAVHDGVRPFVPAGLLNRCFLVAEEAGSAVPVVPVRDTLRHRQQDAWQLVPRSEYRLMQTPQVFRAQWLRDAYRQPFQHSFTDDASVVEAASYSIHYVEGEEQNFKVTSPYDLRLAELLLQKKKQ